MSKRIIYLLLAVSLGLNAGVIITTLVHRTSGPPPGPAHDRGAPPGRRAGPVRLVEDHLRGMTHHLGLDADQQQAVRQILEQRAPRLASLQQAADAAGRRLSEAFAAPVFDPDEFLRLTAETSAARSRLDSLSAEILMAEAVVLTPEQRVEFSSVAPMMQGAGQRPPRDGGPPRGGPPPERRKASP